MKERYADDVQSLDVDAIIRELVVATENWILDHNKGAGDVKRAFEERLEELGLAHLRHGPGCRRAEPGGRRGSTSRPAARAWSRRSARTTARTWDVRSTAATSTTRSARSGRRSVRSSGR
jgi:hypothetical protein